MILSDIVWVHYSCLLETTPTLLFFSPYTFSPFSPSFLLLPSPISVPPSLILLFYFHRGTVGREKKKAEPWMSFHVFGQVWLRAHKVKLRGRERRRWEGEQEGRRVITCSLQYIPSSESVELCQPQTVLLTISLSRAPPLSLFFSNPLIQAVQSIEEFLLKILLTS